MWSLQEAERSQDPSVFRGGLAPFLTMWILRTLKSNSGSCRRGPGRAVSALGSDQPDPEQSPCVVTGRGPCAMDKPILRLCSSLRRSLPPSSPLLLPCLLPLLGPLRAPSAFLLSYPYSGRTCFGANRRRRNGCSVPSPCSASRMGTSGPHSLSIPGNCSPETGTLGSGQKGQCEPGGSRGPHLACRPISYQLSS